MFLRAHGRVPDVKRRLYNDYLYSLKITGALGDPLRVFVTDKEYSKIFVNSVVGERYVMPTLAVLRSEEEIRNYEFPKSCAIKGTHGSGQYIIRRAGEAVDIEKVVHWLRVDYYALSAERNYLTLKPKVIVEPLAEFGGRITELYIHCYRGEPRVIRVILNRFTEPHLNVFDCEWRPTGISYLGRNTSIDIPCPKALPEILRVARDIAAHFESIRVDVYVSDDRIWVGELTNCQSSAGLVFDSDNGEEVFSNLYFGPTGVCADRK
jgi:hypothetical protein